MKTFLTVCVAPLFYKLVLLSCSASCIGLCVLLLRSVADRKIPPRWKNALWALMLIALIVPYRIPSRIAVVPQDVSFSVTTQTVQPVTPTITDGVSAQNEDVDLPIIPQVIQPQPTAQVSMSRTALIFTWILPSVWGVGLVAMLIYLFVGRCFLARRLRQSEILAYQNKELIADCKRQLHIEREIPVIVQNYLQTPAITGLFTATVYLPAYVNNMSEQSIEYILLHEFAHYKRGDLWYRSLLLMLQIVYWFNPILWVLFYFVRQDLEVCNDDAVLHLLQPNTHKNYACAMLEVLGKCNSIPMTPRLLCMIDNKKNLKRRIQIMKSNQFFHKYRVSLALLSFALIALLAALFFTKPLQGTKPDESNLQSASSSVASSSVTGASSEQPVATATSSATPDVPTVTMPTLITFADGIDDGTYSFFDSYSIGADGCLEASYIISDAEGNELQTIAYTTQFNQSWYNTYLDQGGKMVRFLDVDFDGDVDFVGQLCGDEQNQYYNVWLYDAATKKFTYSEEYSQQSNPVYNTQTQYYLATNYTKNEPSSYMLFVVQRGHLGYLGAIDVTKNADNTFTYTERMYGDINDNGELYWREVQTSNVVSKTEELSPLWSGFSIELTQSMT